MTENLKHFYIFRSNRLDTVMHRNCTIRHLVGRYETNGDDGETKAVQVAVTKVDTCGGTDPHEVILMKFDNNKPGASSVQRVVVDLVATKKYQGQNLGTHGEGGEKTFGDQRIKNLEVLVHPCDFLSGDGNPLLNMQLIVKEFRYIRVIIKCRVKVFFQDS